MADPTGGQASKRHKVADEYAESSMAQRADSSDLDAAGPSSQTQKKARAPPRREGEAARQKRLEKNRRSARRHRAKIKSEADSLMEQNTVLALTNARLEERLNEQTALVETLQSQVVLLQAAVVAATAGTPLAAAAAAIASVPAAAPAPAPAPAPPAAPQLPDLSIAPLATAPVVGMQSAAAASSTRPNQLPENASAFEQSPSLPLLSQQIAQMLAERGASVPAAADPPLPATGVGGGGRGTSLDVDRYNSGSMVSTSQQYAAAGTPDRGVAGHPAAHLRGVLSRLGLPADALRVQPPGSNNSGAL